MFLFSCEERKESNENQSLLWFVKENKDKGCLELVKEKNRDQINLSPEEITKINNNKWKEVAVQVVKISNDTIFLTINNSDYLTQQMGSTGAAVFMATTTYNFTELPGIKFVNFNFNEGDHAQPGTYKRGDFKCI